MVYLVRIKYLKVAVDDCPFYTLNILTPALRIPTGILYLGVAVGWALSTIVALYMFIKSAKVAVSPIQKSAGGDKL